MITKEQTLTLGHHLQIQYHSGFDSGAKHVGLNKCNMHKTIFFKEKQKVTSKNINRNFNSKFSKAHYRLKLPLAYVTAHSYFYLPFLQ